MEQVRKDLPIAATEFTIINRTGVTRSKRAGTVVREIAVAVFDTSVNDSSAVSNKTAAAHGLGVYLPTKAIVINAWTDIPTAFTSGTSAATIALSIEGAGDLVAGIAINAAGARWGAGLGGCLPASYAEATVAGDTAILDAARRAASFIKTTAVREVTATVGVEALTAGKMNIYLEYVLSD